MAIGAYIIEEAEDPWKQVFIGAVENPECFQGGRTEIQIEADKTNRGVRGREKLRHGIFDIAQQQPGNLQALPQESASIL